MKHEIGDIDPSEYPEVLEVWEASVRSTHHFLTETDIAYFKPLILEEYLDLVELKCVRNESGKIMGFSGVAEKKLEMLFIHPAYIGKGIGKVLLHYSIENQEVTQVDVNEQNEQALGFYLHCGFQTVGRSELDASGKPYPILHMELKGN